MKVKAPDASFQIKLRKEKDIFVNYPVKDIHAEKNPHYCGLNYHPGLMQPLRTAIRRFSFQGGLTGAPTAG
jgi:hypothetical protein